MPEEGLGPGEGAISILAGELESLSASFMMSSLLNNLFFLGVGAGNFL